ncbi:MAG: hypothetical protein KDJ15_05890 [Alphaproteobacteria bacterium]|nr:hypothetical protein [Alphaproteobacteria bacterium]
MLALILMLVLGVTGGLFAGTILYTAHKAAKIDHLHGIVQQMWDAPLSL